MGEWCDEAGSKASRRKVYLAKGVKYFDKIKVGEFVCEAHQLAVGDEIIITGPTTGYVQMQVNELRVDEKATDKVVKGDTFSMRVNEKIRPSDKLYKLVPAK